MNEIQRKLKKSPSFLPTILSDRVSTNFGDKHRFSSWHWKNSLGAVSTDGLGGGHLKYYNKLLGLIQNIQSKAPSVWEYSGEWRTTTMAVDTTSVPVPRPHQPCCWFMESYLYLADWPVPGHLAPAVGSRGSTHGTMKTVADDPHLTYSFYLNVPAHTTRTSLQHPSLTITIIITSTSTYEETTPLLVCLHLPPPPSWEWVARGKF